MLFRSDLINGLGCKGRQVIGKADLQETDTQTGIFAGLEFVRKLPQKAGKRNIKIRDAVRKAAFGMNFAVIGIESQETMDYELPLRNLSYPMCRKTPCFSYGDIRHFHQIYASI